METWRTFEGSQQLPFCTNSADNLCCLHTATKYQSIVPSTLYSCATVISIWLLPAFKWWQGLHAIFPQTPHTAMRELTYCFKVGLEYGLFMLNPWFGHWAASASSTLAQVVFPGKLEGWFPCSWDRPSGPAFINMDHHLICQAGATFHPMLKRHIFYVTSTTFRFSGWIYFCILPTMQATDHHIDLSSNDRV